MTDLMKRLLGAPDLKNLPGVEVELPRLSAEGSPFVVRLRPLSWQRIGELRAGDADEAKLKLILAACPELSGRMAPEDIDPEKGILTAEDLLRARLLPGEIESLVNRIDLLCGYSRDAVVVHKAVEEVKN